MKWKNEPTVLLCYSSVRINGHQNIRFILEKLPTPLTDLMAIVRSSIIGMTGRKIFRVKLLRFSYAERLSLPFIANSNSRSIKTLLHPLKFPRAVNVDIPVRIINPDSDTLRFDYDASQPSYLVYHIHHKDTFVVYQQPVIDLSHLIIPGSYADTTITIRTPDKPGKYLFWISIQTGWFPAGRNENYQTMEID